PGRGEPHGSQDGYKRFQQQLWEQRQRGGPWAVKSRRNTERGVVASPAALRVRNEPSYLPLLLLSFYLCRTTPSNSFASPRRLTPQRLTPRHDGALGRRRTSRRRTRRCCSTRRSG
ncbi:MAG: hypothetical protein VX747_10110, partial [Actinomycetota bacterium]|nr:hypothetical protein [Actinomycetota bacterium]